MAKIPANGLKAGPFNNHPPTLFKKNGSFTKLADEFLKLLLFTGEYFLDLQLAMIIFMKRLVFFLTACILSVAVTLGQDQESPYNARTYFEAEHNSAYLLILGKIEDNKPLTSDERKYLTEYEAYLLNFYRNLSDSEKTRYEENKAEWLKALERQSALENADSLDITPMGNNPARKFYLNNSLYGLGYGITSIFILEAVEYKAALLPIVTTGISLVYPAANPKKYRDIDYSTVMMTRHGKFIGILDGAALGFLLFGDISEDSNKGKAFASTLIATSVALGEVGFHVGKKKRFAEGQVATFKYYSLLVPFLTFSGLVAGNVHDPRIYGASVLAAGAASYWYAGKVYNKYKFTRGDMLATSSLGLLSTGLGFGISPMEKPWHFIFPAVTAIGGTFAGHKIFKNSRLTSREGKNINYATMVGTGVGFIVAVFVPTDTPHHVMLLVPAATGAATWALYTSKTMRRQRQTTSSNNRKWADFSFSFTPQNYFINKQLERSRDGSAFKTGLPMFSMKIKL